MNGIKLFIFLTMNIEKEIQDALLLSELQESPYFYFWDRNKSTNRLASKPGFRVPDFTAAFSRSNIS